MLCVCGAGAAPQVSLEVTSCRGVRRVRGRQKPNGAGNLLTDMRDREVEMFVARTVRIGA